VVVWMHGSEIFVGLPGIEGRGAWLYEAASVADLGLVGVVAFFLISGFVIPHSLHGDVRGGIRRFGIRRFFRLFPAFWLSIPLGYAAVWVLWKRPFDMRDVLANVTMVPAVFSREAAMGLYWTLETELVFYLLITVLFALGVLQRPAVLLGILLSLLAVTGLQRLGLLSRPELSQWAQIPFSLALMFCGSLCRYAMDGARDATSSPDQRKRAIFFGLIALFAISTASVAIILIGRSPRAENLGAAYLLGIALFIATVLVLQRPPVALAWLGTISYSLYLLHPVVLYVMAWVLTHVVNVSAPFGVGTLLIFLGAGSIALAASSYYAVELPAINVARRLTSR